MSRSGPRRFAMLAGVSIAVAASFPAVAQTPLPVGSLRASIEERADEPKSPTPTRPAPATRPPLQLGQVPAYGNPPASGAGTTGFDSTNSQRRRPRPAVPSQPQGILGPAAVVPLPPGVSRPSRPGLPRLPALIGIDPPRPGSTATTPPPAADSPSSGAPPPLASPPPPPPRRGAGNPPTASTSATSTSPTATAPATAGPPPITLPLPGVAPATAGLASTGAVPPATPRRPRPAAEDDPFDPTGIRYGTFVLRPAIEVTSGYDTNPARQPDARGSVLYIVAPELLVRSDWERHQLNADIRSSYSEYPAVSLVNRPNVDAKVDGRIDVTRDAKIDLQGRYLLSTDYPGSPNIPVGIAKLPIFTTVGATAGFTQRFNRFELALKGTVDRTAFADSILLDGSSSSNRDRNYNQYGAALRGSYELTPGVKPFAEIGGDTRLHDLAVDRDGAMRDSQAVIPRVGSTFEITRKLTGEVSVGYMLRTFKDPALPDVRGLITDASLVWTATGLTTVKLTAKSTAEETVLPGVSAALRRDAGLEVTHAFRRWLIGTIKLGYGLDDYVGATRVDNRYSASAALTYKLTRSVQIKGELRQEWLRSNTTGVDYTATVMLLGLRLQR